MTQAPQWEHFSTKSMERWMLPRNSGSQPGTTCLSVAARQAWVPAPHDSTRKASASPPASLSCRRMRLTSSSWQPVWTISVKTTFLPCSSSLAFISATSGSPPVRVAVAHSPQPRMTMFVSPSRSSRTSSKGFFWEMINLRYLRSPGDRRSLVLTSSRAAARAARRVLRASIMLVTAPTPPGTGVMALALAETAS